jgi:PAS domain S-box-containing protein
VREDLELCLRGHLAQVAVPEQWSQLRELAHSVNRLIARWKKAERGGAVAGPEPAALQALVLDMPVPVFLVDSERRILEVSQAACSWLGAARGALVGRGIGEVLPDPAFLDTLASTCARVGAGEATSLSQTTRIGANRVALRAVGAGSQGVVAVVALG